MSIINFKFLISLLHCKDDPWVKAQYIVHLTSYYLFTRNHYSTGLSISLSSFPEIFIGLLRIQLV